MRGPCKVVIKMSSAEKSQSSFETAACRPGYELGSRVGSCRIMAKNKLGGAKKTSCVLQLQ
jgi:hypothetical protein